MARLLALLLISLLPVVSAGGAGPGTPDGAAVSVAIHGPLADAEVSPEAVAVRVHPVPTAVELPLPQLLPGPAAADDAGAVAPAASADASARQAPLAEQEAVRRAVAGASLAAALVAVAWAVLHAAGFAPWVPSFSRIEDGRLAEHPARRAALDFIQANPGATVSEVQAALGLAWGTTVHHLRRLERAGLLAVRRDGGRVGHWPLGQAPPRDGLASTLRATAALVRSSPGLAQKEIARILGVGAPAACKRLAALEEAGLVAQVKDGRSRLYVPTATLLGMDLVPAAVARAVPAALAPQLAPAVATVSD